MWFGRLVAIFGVGDGKVIARVTEERVSTMAESSTVLIRCRCATVGTYAVALWAASKESDDIVRWPLSRRTAGKATQRG